jgi:hypothetical protein
MEIAGMTLGFIAVVGGLAIAPLSIGLHFRHERRKREMEHMERMKALELGRTLPQDEPWFSPLRIALLIGGAVPLGAFTSVGLATAAVGFHDGMWLAACIVGTASVISGSTLAVQSLKPRETALSPSDLKPYVEEDAYDVVSARG